MLSKNSCSIGLSGIRIDEHTILMYNYPHTRIEVDANMRDLLSLKHLSGEEIMGIVERGIDIKKNPSAYEESLKGTNLLMLFQKTSTRTRLSFELGIQELGGRAIVMDWNKSNFSISPIRYEAMYVARHVDLIMARLVKHTDVVALADASPVPVINGCCEKYHPTQGLADLMTVYEKAGTLQDVTLAYVGIHNNVANSLVAGRLPGRDESNPHNARTQ